MILGKVGAARFREITQTEHVQKRIELARDILSRGRGFRDFWCGNIYGARQIAEHFAEQTRSSPAAYLGFGGDVAGMTHLMDSRTYFCFDRLPFVNETTTAKLSLMRRILVSSARQRNRCGYFHVYFYTKYKETALTTIFDVVGLGGEPKVWEAEGYQGLYKIEFNLAEESYNVFIVQQNFASSNSPDLLTGVPLGSVLIKSATRDSGAYATLGSYVPSLPSGALIVSDKEINSPFLIRIEVASNERDLVELSCTRVSPRITPFGYSGNEVFLYKRL